MENMKPETIEEKEMEEVSGGGFPPLTYVCQRCGCRVSPAQWNETGGYCRECAEIVKKGSAGVFF